MKNKNSLALVLLVALIAGSVYIINSERPIVKNADEYAQLANNEEAAEDTQEAAEENTEKETDSQVNSTQESQTEQVNQTQQESTASTTEASKQASNETTPSTTKTKTSGPLTYSMTEVQSHSTTASCWSVVGGSVYDLTTWINRHPGGPDKIIAMCGADASSTFQAVHGKSNKAKNALALLKIGTLN